MLTEQQNKFVVLSFSGVCTCSYVSRVQCVTLFFNAFYLYIETYPPGSQKLKIRQLFRLDNHLHCEKFGSGCSKHSVDEAWAHFVLSIVGAAIAQIHTR